MTISRCEALVKRINGKLGDVVLEYAGNFAEAWELFQTKVKVIARESECALRHTQTQVWSF